MRLSKEETYSKGTKLALAAAVMVILGYPGEVILIHLCTVIVDVVVLAMIPFVYIVWDLVSGLGASISKQPKAVQGLVSKARTLTVCHGASIQSFFFPMIGLQADPGAVNPAIQVGYTVADVVAKALFGVMIYMIAQRKSDAGA